MHNARATGNVSTKTCVNRGLTWQKRCMSHRHWSTGPLPSCFNVTVSTLDLLRIFRHRSRTQGSFLLRTGIYSFFLWLSKLRREIHKTSAKSFFHQIVVMAMENWRKWRFSCCGVFLPDVLIFFSPLPHWHLNSLFVKLFIEYEKWNRSFHAPPMMCGSEKIFDAQIMLHYSRPTHFRAD